MIQAQSLRLYFGNRAIFNDISFIIQGSERIGLVGRNGAGKTTLLRALQDQTVLDGGTVSIQKGKKIAYMPQEVVLESALSVLAETLTAYPELSKLKKEMAQLEEKCSASDDDELLARYWKVHERYTDLEPERLQAQAKKVLSGLGFSQEQFTKPVMQLSVGWKMRIVLAKLLLQNADFYLFDEPTNHLDLLAKEWFLHFLKRAPFGFMIISHEKYFLDELCTKILELEHGHAHWYTGNYSRYLTEKEARTTRTAAAYAQQQKEIKKKEQTIDRLRAGQNARMAQSMEKTLAKMERIEIGPDTKMVHFQFPPVQQAGKEVLIVRCVGHTFNNAQLFKNVSFTLKRGSKAALVAPNGVGKSTLLNLIAGTLPLQSGTITLGHNVSFAFFNQDQNAVLNKNKSIYENIKNLCGKVTEHTIRHALGAFLFSGDDILKPVSVLSGGEKNRVGMVNILLQSANFLLLDEPTNHLDIPSKEVLLNALKHYQGTVLFVSHDKDFINDLATEIIELTPQGVHQYQGNFDDYLTHKKQITK